MEEEGFQKEIGRWRFHKNRTWIIRGLCLRRNGCKARGGNNFIEIFPFRKDIKLSFNSSLSLSFLFLLFFLLHFYFPVRSSLWPVSFRKSYLSACLFCAERYALPIFHFIKPAGRWGRQVYGDNLWKATVGKSQRRRLVRPLGAIFSLTDWWYELVFMYFVLEIIRGKIRGSVFYSQRHMSASSRNSLYREII